MKKVVISFAMLIIGACSSNDSLFPSMASDSANVSNSNVNNISEANFPNLGSTNFSPINIAKGESTGTFVGQKVTSFRGELTNLQEAIRKHNDDLQRIRTSVKSNTAEYQKSVSGVESKLQTGTTPGNPYVVASLQNAQNNIRGMNDNAIATNQLSTRVVSDIAMTSYVMNSIKASYSVSGAVDEDHQQLKVLQGEAEKTNVILNNMLNEINGDFTRQQQYIETANRTILSLEEPVRVGRFGGVGKSTPVVISPLTQKVEASNLTLPNPSDFSSRPLFSVKFNKEDVNYKDGLKVAVKSALKAKPDMMFDIVAVSPVKASYNAKATARNKATEIFQEVIKAGVSPEKISLSAKSTDEAKSPEVHIYIK